MNNSSKVLIIVAACGVIALLACAVCGVGGLIAYQVALTESPAAQVTWDVFNDPPAQPSPALPTRPSPPRPQPGSATPGAQTGSPELNAALETLQLFNEEVVPINDPIDLANRLEGRTGLARELQTITQTYQVGDEQTYWVTNSDTNESVEVDVTLRYVSDHVYFWIENGLSYNESDLRDLVETFDDKIYPRNREFFGSEWSPGVDADPRLYIVYARGLGGNVAGYYSSSDEYLPAVREKANGHEMFLLSADHLDLGDEYTYGVLAHEFQHMIHWYRDRNEETWMNEGFSDLAMFLNDYDIGGADRSYASDADLQLNDWPSTPDNRTAHYGASFLFLAYYLDRFGEKATQALVADEANGMASIDNVLTSLSAKDAETGAQISAEDVFADWVIASYLQDETVGDGRFTYHNYPSAPKPAITETIDDCSSNMQPREVSQYGVDYIRLRCQGDYTLRIEGSQWVNALPSDPHSGSYAFYSNRGDESNMTLTRTLDFTQASGPLTLSFWTWYDLEKDYDYLFLTASTDGENWEILTTPSGTANDPAGNSYGWGYNGLSGDGPKWIEEKIDLSRYAGKQVQLRFEYITDAAVNGEGFLIDDISIPEIGYSTDFEADDGGWAGDGFVRIQNILPQSYRVAVVRQGGETTVEKIAVPEDGVIEIPLTFDRTTREIVLVISGVSRFTRQKAFYQFAFLPK